MKLLVCMSSSFKLMMAVFCHLNEFSTRVHANKQKGIVLHSYVRIMTTAKCFAHLCCCRHMQVLKGDIKRAIEIHEMLYQVIQRHNFLPEAFTTDFRVHWAQHPLRPEFIESTYFLYRVRHDSWRARSCQLRETLQKCTCV